MKLPGDLVEAFRNGEAAFVVGSGITIASTKSDAMRWDRLLLDGIDECRRLRRIDDNRADVMRQEVATGDVDDLLSVGQKVTRALGGDSSGDFSSWLRRNFASLQIRDARVLDAIRDVVQTFPQSKIATTNYDHLLDAHLGWRPVTWAGSPDRAQRVLRGREHGVLHVHGSWDEPESVVLGVSSYDHFLRNSPAINLLRTLTTMKTLVFLGFGNGFGDPTFRNLLRFLELALARSSLPNFLLVLDRDVSGMAWRHQPEQRIIPVGYGESYESLPQFLRDLRAEAREMTYRDTTPDVSATSSGTTPLVADAVGIHRVSVATDFYGSVDWAGLLATSSELDIFVTYAYTWRYIYDDALTRFMERDETRMRVVLPDLESESAALEIAKRAGQDLATLSDRVAEAIRYFRNLGAEIRLHDAAQTFTSYRFDSTVVVAALYPHTRGQAPGVPTMLIEGHSALAQWFLDDFDEVWKRSRPSSMPSD